MALIHHEANTDIILTTSIPIISYNMQIEKTLPVEKYKLNKEQHHYNCNISCIKMNLKFNDAIRSLFYDFLTNIIAQVFLGRDNIVKLTEMTLNTPSAIGDRLFIAGNRHS